MPADLDHILEQGGSAAPTYLMELLLSKILSVQITGSTVTIGTATYDVDAPRTMYGAYADQPTVAEAQAALGVTTVIYYSLDTGASYITSAGAWVVM